MTRLPLHCVCRGSARYVTRFFVFSVLLVACCSIGAAETIRQERQSGPVKITLSLDPKEPVIGDIVTLSINVVAEKEVEVLMPDFGQALDRFSIVDFAPRETIDDDGRTVATQTYRLDPPSSGRHIIPPILIEYVDRRDGQKAAPDDLDAYEVLTERIPFNVASVLPDDASAELRPPMGKLDPIPTGHSARWGWLIAAITAMVVASPFVIKSLLAARRRGRRRSAYDVAQNRLQKLLSSERKTPDQIDAFYVQLSNIVRRYIEDRFDMRAPELTTEEFLASIGDSPDFSDDHQRLLREFLRQADLVKFARAEPTDEDTTRTIDKAKRFLEETREDAPLIDEDQPAANGPASDSSAEVIHG